jgi:hypothetical protein
MKYLNIMYFGASCRELVLAKSLKWTTSQSLSEPFSWPGLEMEKKEKKLLAPNGILKASCCQVFGKVPK